MIRFACWNLSPATNAGGNGAPSSTQPAASSRSPKKGSARTASRFGRCGRRATGRARSRRPIRDGTPGRRCRDRHRVAGGCNSGMAEGHARHHQHVEQAEQAEHVQRYRLVPERGRCDAVRRRCRVRQLAGARPEDRAGSAGYRRHPCPLEDCLQGHQRETHRSLLIKRNAGVIHSGSRQPLFAVRCYCLNQAT